MRLPFKIRTVQGALVCYFWIIGTFGNMAIAAFSTVSSEQKELQEVESLLSNNLTDSAKTRVTQFLKSHPHSHLLPSFENLMGLSLLKERRSPQAVAHFKKAIELSTDQAFQQYILYNLATSQVESHALDEAEETLHEIHPELLDKSNQMKVVFLQASLHEQKGHPLEASRYLFEMSKQLSESDQKGYVKAITQLLNHALQSISDLSLLEKLYQEVENHPLADVLLFRIGSQDITLGNTSSGELRLKKLISLFPQSPFIPQAKEILANINNFSSLEGQSIGVLLPLKGKFAKFGTKSLQGIELALGIFNSSVPDSKLKLILEDSGDDSESAIQGLNRLIFKHRVVAVIGPMLSKGVDQVAQRAQELGIPLISLSRRSSIPQDYVFQAGLTQQIQATEIARYAVQKLGLKKLAILCPNEKFETEFSYAFWDAVVSLGGEIVGMESYPPGETDFRQFIDKLSGLYYPDARQRELDLLAQEREANHITKRSRKTEQFYNLRPIVDYQGIFIPDEAKIAGQILPTFSYRDVDRIKFLGTSAWNTPDFITRSQGYGDSSFFVDAYFSENSTPLSKSFFESYRSTFSQDPSSLEAIAYDAAKILQSILNSSPQADRKSIRDQLKAISNFQGVTGKITYKNGQFFRNLKIITVKSGQMKEVENQID